MAKKENKPKTKLTETRFPLIRDTRGKKSWSLTFCVFALIFDIVVLVAWLFNMDNEGLLKEVFQSMTNLAETFSQMTIGAFVVRELADKGKDIYSALKGIKQENNEETNEE